MKLEDYLEDTHYIVFYINGYMFRIYTVPIGNMTNYDGWNFTIKDTMHKDKVVFKDITVHNSSRTAVVAAVAAFLGEKFDTD